MVFIYVGFLTGFTDILTCHFTIVFLPFKVVGLHLYLYLINSWSAMSKVGESPQPKNQQEFVESIEHEEQTLHTIQDEPQVKKAQQDQALQLIEEVGHSTILTPENNKHVLRKIDLRLLPIMLVIYFLQQLDKSTLSYASVFGLQENAHLHGHQYSWLGAVVYVAQLVFQPLVSYLLVKVPMGKFLAASVLCWGISLSCMAAANTFATLMVCRLFLGIFEAGLGKSFHFIRSMGFLLLTIIQQHRLLLQ